MTNQTSIKYISSLLDSPGSITDGDQSSISLFRQTFPYFVPMRYLVALESHKKSPFTPQMLSAIQPYMGDWVLFSDFLAEGCKPIDGQLAAINKVVDKKNVEIHRSHTEQEVVSVAQIVPLVPSAVIVEEKKEEVPPVPVVASIPVMEQAPPAPAAAAPVVAEAREEVMPVHAAKVEETKEQEIPVTAPVNAPVAEETEITETQVPVGEGPILIEVIYEQGDVVPVEDMAPYAEPVLAASAEAPEDIFAPDTFAEVAIDNSMPAEAAEAQVETIEEAVEIVNEAGPAYTEPTGIKEQDPLIFPIYTKDYFLQQGEKVSDEIPLEINELKDNDATSEEDKSLMVVMSFSEWLLHFKNSSEKQKEESKDQKALKTMWQKEKLAAAMEEENEEIPETVFEMAVNSISKEEGLVSETLAEIYIKQGKYDKAVEMYRKLSLKNPQKNAYFAHKIDEALKDKQS